MRNPRIFQTSASYSDIEDIRTKILRPRQTRQRKIDHFFRKTSRRVFRLRKFHVGLAGSLGPVILSGENNRRSVFPREFRLSLALGRPAAASKTPKDGRIYAPTFSGFLPRPRPAAATTTTDAAAAAAPSPSPTPLAGSLPRCFCPVVPQRESRGERGEEALSFRESVARFSLAHGAADKRAGEGTIKRDGNYTGWPIRERLDALDRKSGYFVDIVIDMLIVLSDDRT